MMSHEVNPDPAAVPGFEQFYALYLARDPRSAVDATVLRELYLDYAAATGAPGLSFRQIKRLMQARGHCHFRSNTCRYSNLMIVRRPDAQRAVIEPFAAGPTLAASRVVAALSNAIADMEATRARLLVELGGAEGAGRVAA